MVTRQPFRISGTGCALVDYLYKPVDFNAPSFSRFLSKSPGDGGLTPGKLVFSEEFEKYCGVEYPEVRHVITSGKPPVTKNIGGPSVVSLIHAAQMLHGLPVDVEFNGCRGNDESGTYIEKKLAQTPLKTGLYKTGNHYTPFTDVLSDPKYDEGNGERIFINNIGAAWDMNPSDLKDSFFRSDLIVFGGTALVPNIHNALDHLLERAKVYHGITIVNTVFDFLSEKHDPVNPWKLGSSEKTYRSIDLLITDREESLRLSGTSTVEAAMQFFKKAGVGSLIITHGSNDIHIFADNALFGLIPKSKLPVSAKVRSQLKEIHEPAGDTTGCGDNFAGGVIASIAVQLLKKQGPHIDFKRAISLGVASGGYTCFYNGGTYFEDHPGSKAQLIEPYYQEYLKQINLLT